MFLLWVFGRESRQHAVLTRHKRLNILYKMTVDKVHLLQPLAPALVNELFALLTYHNSLLTPPRCSCMLIVSPALCQACTLAVRLSASATFLCLCCTCC